MGWGAHMGESIDLEAFWKYIFYNFEKHQKCMFAYVIEFPPGG